MCERVAPEVVKASAGKRIKSLRVGDDQLTILFMDGSGAIFRDDGQDCCEQRYMSTDDDLDYYEGAALVDIGLRDGPDIEDEFGDVHEVQFLVIRTDRGNVTIQNHNEHNGYYGGFRIVWCRISPPDALGQERKEADGR